MKSLILAGLSAIFVSGAAHASVLDLNGVSFGNGEILADQFDGVSFKAKTIGGGKSNNFAIIIDTDVDTSNNGTSNDDPDLMAPFTDPTTGEVLSPGNVIALAENGCGNGFCNPDDNAQGGTLEIEFDRDVVLSDLAIFDFKLEELTIQLFDSLGDLVSTVVVPVVNNDTGNNPNNNLFSRVSFLDDQGIGATFRRAVFTFDGSGAIGDFNISEVPVPAALPLLLSGIAGLSFASRRRRKQA